MCAVQACRTRIRRGWGEWGEWGEWGAQASSGKWYELALWTAMRKNVERCSKTPRDSEEEGRAGGVTWIFTSMRCRIKVRLTL